MFQEATQKINVARLLWTTVYGMYDEDISEKILQSSHEWQRSKRQDKSVVRRRRPTRRHWQLRCKLTLCMYAVFQKKHPEHFR